MHLLLWSSQNVVLLLTWHSGLIQVDSTTSFCSTYITCANVCLGEIFFFFFMFCSCLTCFTFKTFLQYFTNLYHEVKVPCLIPVLPAGDLSATPSRVACSCGHRSPTPPGKCSAEATGAETDPHLFVSVAQRMSRGCSQTARWGPEVCRLHRSGSPVHFHILI